MAIEARWLEERQEATTVGRPSQDSERARAHLYERKFPAKPVNDCAVAVNAGLVASESCGALDICPGHALFVRTNATLVLGVSDPLQLDHGAKKGGWQRGSLTPRLSPTVTLKAARTRTRAA
jgi:hypothetical protein